MSVQVLQEFYVQATRKTRLDRISHEQASGLIEAWTRFTVQDMTVAILQHALHIKNRYQLSYWDGAIVAAAYALECQRVYSEDLAHGAKIAGVEIFNPFLELT